MDVTPPARTARVNSRRGMWTIVAIFALGGAVLAGLFLAPRPGPVKGPADLPGGFPAEPMLVVAYEVGPIQRNASPAALAKTIRGGSQMPDVVFVLDIDAEQAPGLAQALGMQANYDPRLYQRVPRSTGSSDLIGVMMFSRFPMYEVEPVKRAAKAADGVTAVLATPGRGTFMACLWQPDQPDGGPLLEHWKAAGSPPGFLIGRLPQAESSARKQLDAAGWRMSEEGQAANSPACLVIGDGQAMVVTSTAGNTNVPVWRWEVGTRPAVGSGQQP